MVTLELIALAFLLTYLVHSTLLLGLAWLASRALGERRASRELLWRGAAIGALLTAGVQVGLGVEPLGGRWALPAVAQAPPQSPMLLELRREPLAATEAPLFEAPLPSEASPVPGDPFEQAGRGDLDRLHTPDFGTVWWIERALVLRVGAGQLVSDAELEPLPAAGQAFEPAPTVAANLDPAWRDVDPLRAALLVLVALTLLGLTPLVRGWLHLRKALASGSELRDGALADEWRRLLARAGLARTPRLFLCPGLEAPLTTGILRPRVCLPARAVAELGIAAQRALLAHELAHVERRDPAWALLHAFVERALWIQPLNRVARRELEDLAELACDERALELGARPLDLARCLTDVAGWLVTPTRRIHAAPGMAARPSALSARVRRLAAGRSAAVREPGRGARALLGVAALAAVCAAAPGAAVPFETSRASDAAERLPARTTSAPSMAVAASTAPVGANPEPMLSADLDALLELLDQELAALEIDVADLRELAGQRWENDIAVLEAQVESLREGRARLVSLLPTVRATSSPTPRFIAPIPEPDFVLRPLQPREGEENL